jgi:Tfp pilus assembly protein PilN
VRRPLNLARQPFRNERLPTLALLLGCVLLLGLSVRHALAARDLLPERTSGVDGELVALEQEVDRLRSDAADLRTRRASEEALQEWAVVRDLVDRRAFSWSELLGRLEGVVPAGIRLVSIAPEGTGGKVTLNVGAVGETVQDGLDFLQALQKAKEFEEPFLSSVVESSAGIDFAYTVDYAPGPRASEPEPEAVATVEGREGEAGGEDLGPGASEDGPEDTPLELEPDPTPLELEPDPTPLELEPDPTPPGEER